MQYKQRDLRPVTENEFVYCPRCGYDPLLPKTHTIGDGTVAHGFYCYHCNTFYGGDLKYTVDFKEA